MGDKITLRLPVPPSTNGLFATRKNPNPNRKRQYGRVTTKEYAAWQTAAGWEAKAQLALAAVKRIPGAFKILIELRRPHVLADLDNRIKAPVDLLASLNVIDDDRPMTDCRIRWADVEGCVVTVEAVA